MKLTIKIYFLFALFACIFQSVKAQDTLVLITGKKIIVASVDLKDYTIAYRKMESGSKVKTIDPERLFSIKYRDGHERVIYQPDSLDTLEFRVEEMRSFIIGEQDAARLYRNNLIKGSGFIVGGGAAFFGFYGLAIPPIYATVLGSISPNTKKRLSFKVSGAEEAGIKDGVYLNTVTGDRINPVLQKDQVLKIGSTSLKADQDLSLDSTVALINSDLNCNMIHASNDNGKLKLFKSENQDQINNNAYLAGFGKKVRDYKIRSAMISGLAGFILTTVSLSIILKDKD